MQFYKEILLAIMLIYCGYKDFKYQRISLSITGITFFFILIVSLIEKNIIVPNIIGGFLIGLLLILISKITKGQIGMGDGIIFCVTGIGIGFWKNLYLLFFSLTFSAVIAAILLIFKKANKKKTIPFIPFVCFAYIGVLLL